MFTPLLVRTDAEKGEKKMQDKCKVCKGDGIVQNKLSLGILSQPCYCEAAEKKQAAVKAELQVMLNDIRRRKRHIAVKAVV